MRTHALACITALGLASSLGAQEVHFGFGFNLAFPTGEFREKSYTMQGIDGPTTVKEGFDIGFGGQFTMSFPFDKSAALRMNFGGQGTTGSVTGSGYSGRDLRHSIFSIGGELQLFLNGGALRHRGTYFFFGPSADFESWDYSLDHHDYHDYYYYDYTTYQRKSRLGATFGIGNSFGASTGRFTMEMAFHKTLSGNDVDKGEPPSADFVKLSFGWVF